MIASKKESRWVRKHLTRHQVFYIHAFHSAAFWMALIISLTAASILVFSGFSISVVLMGLSVMLAVSSTTAGATTDLMSMRIPNPISYLLLVSAALWWVLESFLSIPAEGSGIARDVLGLVMPHQGSGSLIPSFDGLFPGSYIALDIVAVCIAFIPTYLSFNYGLGFGGGDVKLMSAVVLFLGWPLGFDFVFLTYLFGGVVSCTILIARTTAKQAKRSGSQNLWVDRMSTVREFAYAPVILLAALFCIAAKSEGFFQ